MLKQLIQLFAEKFLQSKKEWISNQGYPSKRINLDPNLSEYVPPSDGWFGFYKDANKFGTTIDVYAWGYDNQIVSRTTDSISTEMYRCSRVIPVKKGCKVAISSNGMFSECWFSPAVGAENS